MGIQASRPKTSACRARRGLWQQTQALEDVQSLQRGMGFAASSSRKGMACVLEPTPKLVQKRPALKARRCWPVARIPPMVVQQTRWLVDLGDTATPATSHDSAGSSDAVRILASPGRAPREAALALRPASPRKGQLSWDILGFVSALEGTSPCTKPTSSQQVTCAAPYNLWSSTGFHFDFPRRHSSITTGVPAAVATVGNPSACRFPPACFMQPWAFGPTMWKASEIYTICSVGEGGQAAVFLAQMDGVQPFCVKIGKTEEAKAMIKGEALMTLDLHHPNLLQAFAEVVDDAGNPLGFAMEYLQGGDLDAAMRPNNPLLSLQQMASIMRDVVRGVQHLHSCGVLHLDLKPSNIMLEDHVRGQWEAPRAVVVDLGMALMVQHGQFYAIQQGPWGTVSYMDHERAYTGRALVTSASDVFSLGLVMWAIAAQEDPFADLPLDLQWTLLQEHRRHHFLCRPQHCDDSWWQLILWCTTLEPWLRPTTAQLLSELEDLLHFF